MIHNMGTKLDILHKIPNEPKYTTRNVAEAVSIAAYQISRLFKSRSDIFRVEFLVILFDT
jgi:tRNA C32,U32 (ribose-2'-O)-methylase TrmJ